VLPGAPTIVIAQAPAPGLVYIEWQAPANTTVTGYRVYRGTVSGGETFRMSKGATAFSAADVQVTPGVTYYYVVTALSSAGESPWSNEVVVTAV
jgi:fibronectin type 3 domain-containing protein